MEKITLFVILGILSIISVPAEPSSDDTLPLRYLNTSVNPCEDFYEYACGNFKTEHPLTEGVLTIDQFTLLEERLIELAHKILSSEERTEDPQALKKAKTAYKSCVDLSYIDLETQPELLVVEELDGFPLVQSHLLGKSTSFGWNEIGAAASEYGIPMMFNIQAYSDMIDNTKNLIYITPTNMTLPSQIRPYIENSYEEIIEQGFRELGGENSAEKLLYKSTQLKPFDIYLRKMAKKLRIATNNIIDEDELIANIETMANFMKGIYLGGYIPPNTTIEPISKNYSITLNQLNNWTREHFGNTIKLDWVEYMKKVFQKTGIEINENTEVLYVSTLPRLLYGILNWVNMNNDETVKSFVMMRIFLFMASDGDAESREILEEYLRSQNVQILPRWQYCTRKLIDSIGTAGLSFAVAYEYQLRHFDVNILSKALEMIRDLQNTYKENLLNVSWMDDESKAKAIEKFDNMITSFAYPDFATDPQLVDKFYENLRICSWDNYGNTKRMKAFKNAYQISQVARRDRTFWDKSPFEVNAYYNRPNNKMIFPVAMLNPVFFASGNSIIDYGRIGSIVGHEITHGFDEEGRKYDSNGVFTPWWSNDTKNAFDNRTKCFVEQYNNYYVPEIGKYVDGGNTLNENLADNGGVRESYWAMKKMLERTGTARKVAGFTPEQLFFLAYGTTWCNNPSTQYLMSMSTNEHANSKWRVNGVVSNMPEFAEAFQCATGSKMNPTNKCRLW